MRKREKKYKKVGDAFDPERFPQNRESHERSGSGWTGDDSLFQVLLDWRILRRAFKGRPVLRPTRIIVLTQLYIHPPELGHWAILISFFRTRAVLKRLRFAKASISGAVWRLLRFAKACVSRAVWRLLRFAKASVSRVVWRLLRFTKVSVYGAI